MGKDENVMRVDVRVPLGIYERIEVLAEKTNQPFTPKTKKSANPKRIVTPIILKLVELGLKAIDEDSTNLDEDLIRKDIDNSESIEKRLFEKLEARLEALFEVKLDEILAKVKADTITPDIEPHSENEITPESAIEPNEYVKNLNAIEVKSEVIEVSALEDNSEGLSMGKLADRFKDNQNKGKGASKTSISTKVKQLSKEEFITWTQENDPEGKGWYLNEADKLFYLVN